MAIKEGIRPGGRSARVQESVHAAVRALLAENDRAALTVPMVAARAGVTPSTIYRRWGDLGDLLADVAVERLRPDADPLDTGSLQGDLEAWATQLFEEMASAPGQAMVRDVMSCSAPDRGPQQCGQFTAGQVERMRERAHARGEAAPSLDRVLDRVVAPIMYRALYRWPAPSVDYVRSLVEDCLRISATPSSAAAASRPSAHRP